MKSFDEFKTEVIEQIKNKPDHWRDGQAVFNYIDSKYDWIARRVQFAGTDCFYNDKYINEFIEKCYELLTNK